MTGQPVRTGLDHLLAGRVDLLRGRRIALLCHPASVDGALAHAVDRIAACGEGRLACLMGPEHGIAGEAQDMIAVPGAPDPRTGLPVFSLYGAEAASLAPPAEAFQGIDLLVVDLQDIGARYYTFAATMGYAMEAAGRAGVQVAVLDRPNPIGGAAVEGGLVQRGWESFVGAWALPVRHGLTVGEYARLLHSRFGIDCELTVVPMSGWRRGMFFEETGLPWVAPSPNMPTVDTAVVYPGACLFEGTNLSEGRGTTRPFEWVGAPWLDPHLLAQLLAVHRLPGVAFRPTRFTPSFHKWAGQSCGGVQIHVLDRTRFRPFLTGIAVLREARRLGGDRFEWRREAYEFVRDRLAIDLLFGTDGTRRLIEGNAPLADIEASWLAEQESFLQERAGILLY